MNKFQAALAATAIAALALTGCATPRAAEADPSASQAVIETPAEQTPPAPAQSFTEPFGSTYSWESGISVSVSSPVEFTPTEYAAGPVEGQPSVIFKVVLTNNSAEPFEYFGTDSATSGGKAGSAIFDSGNAEYGSLLFPPTTAILPGQTLEWYVAYSVADPANITFQITPDFMYESVIFSNAAL